MNFCVNSTNDGISYNFDGIGPSDKITCICLSLGSVLHLSFPCSVSKGANLSGQLL